MIDVAGILSVSQEEWNRLAMERILQEGPPKQCKVKLPHGELITCPAYALWKGEEYCFYETAFLGKSSRPMPVKDRMKIKS